MLCLHTAAGNKLGRLSQAVELEVHGVSRDQETDKFVVVFRSSSRIAMEYYTKIGCDVVLSHPMQISFKIRVIRHCVVQAADDVCKSQVKII